MQKTPADMFYTNLGIVAIVAIAGFGLLHPDAGWVFLWPSFIGVIMGRMAFYHPQTFTRSPNLKQVLQHFTGGEILALAVYIFPVTRTTPWYEVVGITLIAFGIMLTLDTIRVMGVVTEAQLVSFEKAARIVWGPAILAALMTWNTWLFTLALKLIHVSVSWSDFLALAVFIVWAGLFMVEKDPVNMPITHIAVRED